MSTLKYILTKYNLKCTDIITIRDAGRDDLAVLLHELNFKTGVEIGVERGHYSEILCRANPQMTVYGVDPWESLDNCINNIPNRRTENHTSQTTCDRYYMKTKQRLAIYPNFKIVKEYSCDAVSKFEDGSLDFVYIDANHESTHVLNDLLMWSKKVRPDGIVAGHDYFNTNSSSKIQIHIKNVINKYVLENHIKPLLIWGLDKSPSWAWIKS